MDGVGHDRVTELFVRLTDLPPTERAEILLTLPDEVRREVESLLSGDGHAASRLAPLDRPFEEGPRPSHIGRFELGVRLGGGGMGVVYEASDPHLERPVAIKILHRGVASDPVAKARFKREARAASRLAHRNICAIHEFGETDQGEFFLVMPLYRGETLRERIARGALSMDEVLSIALQVSQGLSEAHARGVVHRDIKPGNILLTTDGNVVILDFGLAMMADVSHITREGATLGTVAYMSPEQVSGEDVDARSDDWSLGVVMYEMLTGTRPFRGDHDSALIYNIRNEEPPAPSVLRAGVPDELDGLVTGLLAKDPSLRIGDAGHRLERLAEVMETPGLAEIQRRSRAERFRRNGRRAGALAVLVVVAIAVAAVLARASRNHAALTADYDGRVSIERFEVLGPESASHFGQGVAELLKSRMDGVGMLSVVDGPRRREGGGAPADVRIAGSVVIGGGGMSVIARLQLRDSLVTLTESGILDETTLPAALDRLALHLVAEILDFSGDEEGAVAARSTNALSALRPYLAGRFALSEGRINDAIDLQIEASRRDSTFALAWYRLDRALSAFAGSNELDFDGRLDSLHLEGLSAGRTASSWGRDLGGVIRAVRAHAFRHSHSLPEAFRLQIEARRMGDGPEVLRIYRILTERYPDDVEFWVERANLTADVDGAIPEAIEHLRRAAALEPDNPRPLAALMNVAMLTRDAAAVDTLLPEYVRLGWVPGNTRGVADGYLLQLLTGGPDERRAAVKEIVDATMGEAFWAMETLASIGRCDLAMTIGEKWRDGDKHYSEMGTWTIGRCDAARGRLNSAARTMLSVDHLYGDALDGVAAIVILFPSRLDSSLVSFVVRQLEQWDVNLRPTRFVSRYFGHREAVKTLLLGLTRIRAGIMPGEEVLGALDSLSSPERDFRNLLLAYAAAARNETARAAELLDAGDGYGTYPYHRWLHAEMRFRSRQYEAALRDYSRMLMNGATYLDDFLDSVLLMRIAECYDGLGETERAAEYYRRFLLYWQDAEPPYQHLARRARGRLALLDAPPT